MKYLCPNKWSHELRFQIPSLVLATEWGCLISKQVPFIGAKLLRYIGQPIVLQLNQEA